MSPRAFQTVLVAPMAPKERKDLESRVLAAAFKQSFQRGDTEGANLAHKQIYLLLKAGENESAAEANEVVADAADNGSSQEPVQASLKAAKEDRAGTREINLGSVEYAKLEVEAMEKLPAKAKAKLTKENAAVAATASATASKLPAQGQAQTSQAQDRSTTTDQELPKANSYVLLHVEPGASFREIHISFLRLVRRLLFEFEQAPKKKRRGMIKELQQISIAHDILSDPLTRTDYDIRFLGLKAPVVGATEGVTESGGVLFKVGELLESAGLLEPTELEIAADMHKAMPEMLFGTFLVKQGFITEGDLEQAVLGQELVKDALIKLDVFKQAMSGWLTSQTPIKDYLVNENIISKEDMDRIVSKNLQEIQVQKVAQAPQPVRGGPASKIQAVSSGPMINTEEAAKRMISKGHAIPGWKDQLDWSQPEEEEITKFEQAVRQDKEYARPDIEDIGSGAAQKSGKKSLRSLMDGIHAPETTDAPKAKTRKTIADLMGPLQDEDFSKPASVDEISNLSQLLQPEDLQVIEALESIDNVAIANDVVRIKDAMSDTSESLRRPMPPQAEKYSDITADKLVPEMAGPPVSIRTWMEEEASLGFGFDEGSYDEEEDVEYAFDFDRSNEEDEELPVARFVEEKSISEDIDNPFDHLGNNEDSLEDDLDSADGQSLAPGVVPSAESEFPQEQDGLWEYVEDNNIQALPAVEQAEESSVEFLEDEEATVEEMVEVEVLVELEDDEDKDPTGSKTREFEIALADEQMPAQMTGSDSGWSTEPFRAPNVPFDNTSVLMSSGEDLEITRERSSNLEETGAISLDLAKRAVAEGKRKAEEESAEESDLGFSVHFVQADEDSTVEDLDPVTIAQENEQPHIEHVETQNQEVDMQASTTPPGNEETSEWQLVYKISGSLADALMNDDDDEADMSNLAPKLDDVNVFITPSQFSGRPITKEWDRVEEVGDAKDDEE